MITIAITKGSRTQLAGIIMQSVPFRREKIPSPSRC